MCVSVVLCLYVLKGTTHVVENDQFIRPPALVLADGEEDAVSRDGGDELLEEQRQERAADDGQVEVVDLEEAVEGKGGPVAHHLAPAEDDNVVGDQDRGGLLERGHGGRVGREAEIGGRVGLDQHEEPLEDGP